MIPVILEITIQAGSSGCWLWGEEKEEEEEEKFSVEGRSDSNADPLLFP